MNCCNDDNVNKNDLVLTNKAPKRALLSNEGELNAPEKPKYSLNKVDETFFKLSEEQKKALLTHGVYDFSNSKFDLGYNSDYEIVKEHQDGAAYIAQTDGKRLNGKGHFQEKNGDFFIGIFKDDKLNGNGAEYLYNGDYFIGTFKNNRKEKGLQITAAGHRYNGEFQNDEYHGYGQFTNKDGRYYEGTYFQGKRDGKGTFKWANGAVYDGEFKNNLQHGKGTYKDGNGKVFTGVFENGNHIPGSG